MVKRTCHMHYSRIYLHECGVRQNTMLKSVSFEVLHHPFSWMKIDNQMNITNELKEKRKSFERDWQKRNVLLEHGGLPHVLSCHPPKLKKPSWDYKVLKASSCTSAVYHVQYIYPEGVAHEILVTAQNPNWILRIWGLDFGLGIWLGLVNCIRLFRILSKIKQ